MRQSESVLSAASPKSDETNTAGTNCAGVKLTDAGRATSPFSPTASHIPPEPASEGGFLFSCEPSASGDLLKFVFDRGGPEHCAAPPRLIRERPVTYLRFAFFLSLLLGSLALECWGVVALWHWVARAVAP